AAAASAGGARRRRALCRRHGDRLHPAARVAAATRVEPQSQSIESSLEARANRRRRDSLAHGDLEWREAIAVAQQHHRAEWLIQLLHLADHERQQFVARRELDRIEAGGWGWAPALRSPAPPRRPPAPEAERAVHAP